MNLPKVRYEKSDNPKGRKRQAFATENPVGLRVVELMGARDLSWLSGETGIPASTLSDSIGKGISKADNAVKIARALNSTVEYLLEGRGPGEVARPEIVDVSKADWVHLPWFDLGELAEDTKGPVRETVPFRRDWLNRRILRSTGLWITELPSDYDVVGLYEGDAVICSDISVGELFSNWVCIFKGLNKPFVARYVGSGADRDDIVVTDNDLAAGDLHPVARIHARLLAKL